MGSGGDIRDRAFGREELQGRSPTVRSGRFDRFPPYENPSVRSAFQIIRSERPWPARDRRHQGPYEVSHLDRVYGFPQQAAQTRKRRAIELPQSLTDSYRRWKKDRK
jgi:hypothetical protein